MANCARMPLYDSNGVLTCKSYVYLAMAFDSAISSEFGFMKIGYSKQPFSRAVQLRTACPMPIIRFTFVEIPNERMGRKVEVALHHHFAEAKSSGEWFRVKWADKAAKADFYKQAAGVIQAHVRKPRITEVNPNLISGLGEANRALTENAAEKLAA